MHANPKQGQVSIPYRHHYAQTWVNFHPSPSHSPPLPLQKKFQPNE